MARRNQPPKQPRQTKKTIIKPWEPSAIQMGWYVQWTEGLLGPTEIARRHVHKVAPQTVCEAVHKVADWIKLQCFDQVMGIRNRQTAIHEKIAKDAMLRYYQTKKVKTVINTGGESDGTQQETIEESESNNAHLKAAMDAMKAIREIWGVNAPAKSEVSVHHPNEIEGLPDPQNFPSRSAAMKAHAAAVLKLADRQEAAERAHQSNHDASYGQ